MKDQKKSNVVKIALLMFFFTFAVLATKAADTLSVDMSHITEVIADTTLTAKGSKTVKYYFIYNGELISTSKTVVEKYFLCKKYRAKLALALVDNKGRKRIILN